MQLLLSYWGTNFEVRVPFLFLVIEVLLYAAVTTIPTDFNMVMNLVAYAYWFDYFFQIFHSQSVEFHSINAVKVNLTLEY